MTRRTVLIAAAALLVAGVVVLIVGSSVAATAVGIALVGFACVIATSFAFFLVGEAEDRDRARRPGG